MNIDVGFVDIVRLRLIDYLYNTLYDYKMFRKKLNILKKTFSALLKNKSIIFFLIKLHFLYDVYAETCQQAEF